MQNTKELITIFKNDCRRSKYITFTFQYYLSKLSILYSVEASISEHIATANVEFHSFWTAEIQPTQSCANTLVQKPLLGSVY